MGKRPRFSWWLTAALVAVLFAVVGVWSLWSATDQREASEANGARRGAAARPADECRLGLYRLVPGRHQLQRRRPLRFQGRVLLRGGQVHRPQLHPEHRLRGALHPREPAHGPRCSRRVRGSGACGLSRRGRGVLCRHHHGRCLHLPLLQGHSRQARLPHLPWRAGRRAGRDRFSP